jgi:transposase
MKTEHSAPVENWTLIGQEATGDEPLAKRAREEGVYQVHDWAKVKELVRQGVSKQHIAERLGCSRTTVYRLLSLETPPRYERTPAGSLLEPFKDAVAAMLRDDATAPATVIREHLQRQGYAGGITILKDYLSEVRPAFLAARDFQRTVYAPGEILQADWWDTGVSVPVGKGASRRAYGMVTTLPFSAAHAVVFTHAQTTADAVPALLGCLERLGGVPAKLVIDRDSSLAVCSRGARPHPVDELAALLGALSMGHIVLPARSPQSKGGVERTNGYLESSFLPLREFSDLADLQAQSDGWTAEVAWPRHHRRVGARVIDALTVERAELGKLPDPLPATERHLEVRASRDGFVRVANVDYSLPPGYAQRRVAVHLSLHELQIFCEGRPIADHVRSYVPADVVRDAEHMAALREAQAAQRRLRGGEPELPAVDLARYDALVGAPL